MRRFEELEPGLHRAEHQAGARAGSLPAAAGGADRRHLPGGAVGGRPTGAGGPHLRRQLRNVQHLHGHAGVAHDRARLGGQPDAARQRVAAAHQRHSARAAIHRRAAGPGEPGRRARRNRIPPGDRGLRQRSRARTESTCVFPPVPRWPWWAIPDRARARWSTCCRGCSTPPAARCCWMESTCGGLDPAELRRHIGFVPQETFLFSATIAGNIAFGVEGATAGTDPPRGGNGGARRRYRRLPAGLRDAGGRARHHPLGRAETAHRDRAGAAARAANPDPRRCPVGGGYTDRRADPHAPGGRDARPHGDPDFAPRFYRAAGGLRSWCWSAARSSSAARTTNWSRPADTTRRSVRSKCWKKNWKPSSVGRRFRLMPHSFRLRSPHRIGSSRRW